VRKALFEAERKHWYYDNCSFSSNGIFTFKGNEDSNPVIGEKGKLHSGDEIKIEVIFEKYLESKILKALFNSHLYEEGLRDL
jgi:hypothetical protein